MNNNDCDCKGGWTRVGYINMSDSGTNNCPRGLNSYDFLNISYHLCDRPHPSSFGCDSTYFSTFDLKYSQVCGRVRGYQYNGVDAIYQKMVELIHLKDPMLIGYLLLMVVTLVDTSGHLLQVKIKMIMFGRTVHVILAALRVHHNMLVMTIIVSLVFVNGIGIVMSSSIMTIHYGMANNVDT